MHAKGIITEQDYVVAQRLHMRFSPILSIVCVCMAALIFWPWPEVHSSAVVETREQSLLRAVVMFVGLVFVYMPDNYYLVIPWQARRVYRQHKALHEPITIDTSADGLQFTQCNGQSFVPWSYFSKRRHDKRLIVLYRTKNMFQLVPSHFFRSTEDFNGFLSELCKRLGKAA